VDDPFGARFAGPAFRRAIELAGRSSGDGVRGNMAAMLPFVLYMQIRTRVIDDAVERFARAGGTQVVLLGAGFDARATRFRALRFFEVDHPATQARKRRLLGSDGVLASERAAYVSWNFETDPMDGLPDTLTAHGHDRSKHTLTIWEGVTMYLREPAIISSLETIHTYSAPGSTLAMTYFDRARLTSPTLFRKLSRALVAAVGEPFRFGFAPSELPAWLALRGYQLEADDDLASLSRRLLPPRFAKRVWDGTSRIAIAKIVA
jgi:methyltransferase (TIGR00027 family)